MKYTLSGLIAVLFLILSGFYFFYPTSEKIRSGYEKRIRENDEAIERTRQLRYTTEQGWKKQDESLSGAINKLKEENVRLEKCRDSLSLDCETAFLRTPTVYAGTDTPAISGVPGGSEDNTVPLECDTQVMGEVTGIEFHYTDTGDDTTLQALKNGHESRFGSDYIGYHYVVKPDGSVINTRDESCGAMADKWNKNNFRHIHIAFIGTDKPNDNQTMSMTKLSKVLLTKYNLMPSPDTISAHQEWGPKSQNESFTHWYGSKDVFLQKVRSLYTITRNGEQLDGLTYAWQTWGDMDFILTIEAESRWDQDAKGDINNPKVGAFSYGYLQYNTVYQSEWYREYVALTDYRARLNHAHEKYTYASGLKGGVGSRFHGFNVRHKYKSDFLIQ